MLVGVLVLMMVFVVVVGMVKIVIVAKIKNKHKKIRKKKNPWGELTIDHGGGCCCGCEICASNISSVVCYAND